MAVCDDLESLGSVTALALLYEDGTPVLLEHGVLLLLDGPFAFSEGYTGNFALGGETAALSTGGETDTISTQTSTDTISTTTVTATLESCGC